MYVDMRNKRAGSSQGVKRESDEAFEISQTPMLTYPLDQYEKAKGEFGTGPFLERENQYLDDGLIAKYRQSRILHPGPLKYTVGDHLPMTHQGPMRVIPGSFACLVAALVVLNVFAMVRRARSGKGIDKKPILPQNRADCQQDECESLPLMTPQTPGSVLSTVSAATPAQLSEVNVTQEPLKDDETAEKNLSIPELLTKWSPPLAAVFSFSAVTSVSNCSAVSSKTPEESAKLLDPFTYSPPSSVLKQVPSNTQENDCIDDFSSSDEDD